MESTTISFDEHVKKPDYWFKIGSLMQQDAVTICQRQYFKCKQATQESQNQIPKILHFIWIGSKPQPKTFVNVYLKQWQDAHPDYEIRVWGEEDVDRDLTKFQLASILKDRELNPGLRADALRYEILKIHGGIYVDTDMALVKPIHSLINGISADLFIGVSHSEAFEVNNAILGCVPGHPFIERAIAKLKSTFEAQSSQKKKQHTLLSQMAAFDPLLAPKLQDLDKDLKSYDVISLSGPGFLTRELFSYLSVTPDSGILILPRHFYYPVSNAFRDQLTPDNYMHHVSESVDPALIPEVYGCHMWESNWQQ